MIIWMDVKLVVYHVYQTKALLVTKAAWVKHRRNVIYKEIQDQNKTYNCVDEERKRHKASEVSKEKQFRNTGGQNKHIKRSGLA